MRLYYLHKLALLGLLSALMAPELLAQAPVQAAAAPAPPPATKLEAFRPAAGSVLTFGYNSLGARDGISVDAREMHDTKGATVRGMVVEVTQSQYREERSFVDVDELPELIRGIDALLAVKQNPTRFESFEVRYTTRGELELTAFSSRGGKTRYAVQAGRTLNAQVFVDEDTMKQLRTTFQTASTQLSAP